MLTQTTYTGSRVKPTSQKRGKGASESSGNPTLNFVTSSNPTSFVYYCRFCQLEGHSNVYCPKFVTLAERLEKCKKLGICSKCTSIRHPIGSCPGNHNNLLRPCRFCNSREHVASLCPKGNFSQLAQRTLNNVCLSNDIGDRSNFLLPILTIGMQGLVDLEFPLMY